jgi:hypothetical protein
VDGEMGTPIWVGTEFSDKNYGMPIGCYSSNDSLPDLLALCSCSCTARIVGHTFECTGHTSRPSAFVELAFLRGSFRRAQE